VKLRHLDDWNALRRRHAAAYGEALAGAAVELPPPGDGVEHVWHLYVVRHPERDAIAAALAEAGIATGVHYPVPVHLQPAYASLRLGPGTFPVSERAAERLLSLPMYPELTEESIGAVAAAVRAAAGATVEA
jgi:dTDP-4-amino-4,6-dideoxygalactose transaminase